MLLMTSMALALDVAVTVAPAPGGLLTETLWCVAEDVKKGELLALPAIPLGESTATPLLEIGSFGSWGVVWLSALQVTTSGGEYPGLISVARPAGVTRAETPCALGQTCTHTFDRTTQSMTLSITATGETPGSAEPRFLIWKTTSWYRPAREVACEAAASPTAN